MECGQAHGVVTQVSSALDRLSQSLNSAAWLERRTLISPIESSRYGVIAPSYPDMEDECRVPLRRRIVSGVGVAGCAGLAPFAKNGTNSIRLGAKSHLHSAYCFLAPSIVSGHDGAVPCCNHVLQHSL